MTLSVNLLPRKGAREVIEKRLFAKLKRGSVFVLAGYMILLLLVMGGRWLISAQKRAWEERVREAKLKVDALAATESQQWLLKSKLQLADSVLKRRNDWSGFLSEVLEFVPDENTVTEVALSLAGDLRIAVETRKLQEAAVMLKALVELGLVHEKIQSVSLGEVKKNTDGAYGFTVVISTKKT